MDMTIDQLARRVDMSTRNIREWQRQGLVAPPTRRGRVGIYSDEHVARIERVRKLHADGLPLDLIRRLTERGVGDESDIRHLADEVLNPLITAGSVTLPRAELVDRFGADSVAALTEAGLVTDGDDDTVTVRDALTITMIEQLVANGLSPQRLAPALVEVAKRQREIASLVLDVFREDVWVPFLSSGFTTSDWGTIADGIARTKPLVIALLSHMFDVALDDVAGTVLLREATEAQRALDATASTAG
jgi:DNA-binding transcriptional MerR regulator